MSTLTVRTIHSLMNPADGLPDIDLTSTQQIPLLRPTPEASRLFIDAEIIYAVDVMSRSIVTIFGEPFSPNGRRRRELAIEFDIISDFPLFFWLLGLTKATKGRIDFQFPQFEFRPGDKVQVSGKVYWTELDLKKTGRHDVIHGDPARAVLTDVGAGYHRVVLVEGPLIGIHGWVNEVDLR